MADRSQNQPLCRWPPVYDAADLQKTIAELTETLRGSTVRSAEVEAAFYAPNPGYVCQGDVIRLDADWVFVGQDRKPAKMRHGEYWACLGNTCDMFRTAEEVRWAQLIPIWDAGPADETNISELASYRAYRAFYFPPFSSEVADRCWLGDFLRPMTIEKASLRPEYVVRSLSYHAWLLFHSCIVRFLARDDGRFE